MIILIATALLIAACVSMAYALSWLGYAFAWCTANTHREEHR